MNLRWSRARALLVGVALIALTNAVVLAGVAYNRSGEPEAVLQLTERELQLRNWSWPSNENSSIDVHLSWRVSASESGDDGGYWYGGLHWLELTQLRELGFDLSGNLELDEESQRVARQPSRRAWLVLEYDGPAYQGSRAQAAKRLEREEALAESHAGDIEFQNRLTFARKEVEREQRFASRLFIVDAALDEEALRARYPDRRRYVIVRGRLNLTIQGQPGHRRPIAQVAEIDVGAIRVPYVYREIVEPLRGTQARYEDGEPRFAATVHFGRRFEPWIVTLEPLQVAQP